MPAALRIGGRDYALDEREATRVERHLRHLDVYAIAGMTLASELEHARATGAQSGSVEMHGEALWSLHAALLAIDREGALTRNLSELLTAATAGVGV